MRVAAIFPSRVIATFFSPPASMADLIRLGGTGENDLCKAARTATLGTNEYRREISPSQPFTDADWDFSYRITAH
jgi:hypothetical protein